MKVVPILHELERHGIPRLFVHTGQHYDVTMSEALLADLAAPAPDVLLGVGSASHGARLVFRTPLRIAAFALRRLWRLATADGVIRRF